MKKVNHILIAIMFNEPLSENFSYFDLVGGFKKEFSNIFGSQDPFAPIPPRQQAPPEIPRYIIKTDDLKYNFSFSQIRFDFNFDNADDFNVDNLKEYIASISKVFTEHNIVNFRVGIVLDGIILGTFQDLRDFVSEETLSNSEEIQISHRNKLDNDGYNYNKWTRYAGIKNVDNLNYQLDLNSINDINFNELIRLSEFMVKEIGEFIGR